MPEILNPLTEILKKLDGIETDIVALPSETSEKLALKTTCLEILDDLQQEVRNNERLFDA